MNRFQVQWNSKNLHHIVSTIEAKSSSQIVRVFARRLPIALTSPMFFQVFDRQNLVSPKFSKIAKKWDIENEFSQNVENLSFLQN